MYMKPILLTGSHRSGTTWVGKILSKSKAVGQIMEPFNVTDYRVGLIKKPFNRWFQYINNNNGLEYQEAIEEMLMFEYRLIQGVKNAGTLRNAGKAIRDKYLFTKFRIKKSRPLVKQPTAIFIAPWFADTFHSDNIVLIRHPAAFVSSINILDWRYDFSELLDQPELITNYLSSFREEIYKFSNAEQPIIDQAILLWKIIHHTIFIYQQKYSDWIYVRHEDLSRNPEVEFRAIFSKLNIDFSKEISCYVDSLSSAQNPSDSTSKSLLLQSTKAVKRNSKENIKNWKNRLSLQEIDYIYNKTGDVANLFYTDEDWE